MKIQNFGLFRLLEIKLQNPFVNYLRSYRRKKAIRYWHNSSSVIHNWIDLHKDIEFYSFKWGQLVYQEIFMYIKLGKQVEKKEFFELCKTRGFTPEMTEFLKAVIQHVGLGKKL